MNIYVLFAKMYVLVSVRYNETCTYRFYLYYRKKCDFKCYLRMEKSKKPRFSKDEKGYILMRCLNA